jgi:uncharacterized delta-60 repeat protein
MNTLLRTASLTAFILSVAMCSTATFAQVPGSVLPSTPRGHAGKAFVDMAGNADVPYASALQADGKLVQVGECDGIDDKDFCVLRYDARLRFDVSFDGDGKAFFQIGQGNDSARAVDVAADGKIVVGGTCRSNPEVNLDQQFCLLRLLPDGSLDATFDGPAGNGNGKFFLSFGAGHTNDAIVDIKIQSDGKIVLLGTCADSVEGRFVFCMARLNDNGTFDDSFDGPNVAQGNGSFMLKLTSSTNHYAQALAIDPDGFIVAVGYCSNGVNDDFCIARLTANGGWDSALVGPGNDANGRFLRNISTNSGNALDRAFAVTLQPDQKILIAGQCRGPTQDDFCLLRLNRDGTLDPKFVEPFGSNQGGFRFEVGSSASIARSVTLQDDGKLLVAGQCAASDGNTAFCVVRLHADGAYDRTFDGDDTLNPGNGRVVVPMTATTDLAQGVHLRPNGDIVLAGYCNGFAATDFCATELHGGRHGAMRCTLNLDQINVAEAASDGLIAVRVALGFRGAEVIAGIASLVAEDWPNVRDYLFNQCGILIE